jgi:hypothetical protein
MCASALAYGVATYETKKPRDGRRAMELRSKADFKIV